MHEKNVIEKNKKKNKQYLDLNTDLVICLKQKNNIK